MSTPEQRALLRQLNLKIDTFRLTDLLDELNAAGEKVEFEAERAEAWKTAHDLAQARIAELESQGRSS